MNIKWGWVSLGSMLLAVIQLFIFIYSMRTYLVSSTLIIFASISAFLSLVFGIVAIVKHQTESKVSFVLAIISGLISLLWLIFVALVIVAGRVFVHFR